MILSMKWAMPCCLRGLLTFHYLYMYNNKKSEGNNRNWKTRSSSASRQPRNSNTRYSVSGHEPDRNSTRSPNRSYSSRFSGGGRSPRGGFSSRGGSRGGFRGIRRKLFTDESKFVKKAMPIAEREQYVPKLKFSELDINPKLKQNITAKGYMVPTPVQDQAIPSILEGKDLLGIANTGTGKTAAFLIPLVEKVLKNRSQKVLIVTPTRELAEQINDELYLLTKGLQIYSVRCIGGNNIGLQLRDIRRGYSFIIGTPGRLLDLMDRKAFNLSQFSTVVLDEVDRMLDMGFIDDIKKMIASLAKERQSLFFSATVDGKVETVINLLLKKDHVRVYVKTGDSPQNVNQDILRVVNRDDKVTKMSGLLKKEEFKKVLVFVNTKREVDRLYDLLKENGFEVELIHGDRKQRERKRAIENFKAGHAKVLLATDVAARGLDISGVTHVINYDLPESYDAYIHRIGRTGRANMMGEAITFVGG